MRKARLTGAMEIPVEAIKLTSIKKELTYTYKPMGAEEALEVRAYTELEDGYIAVPRQYGLDLCNQLQIDWEDNTSQGHPIKFPKVPTPRENQVDILDQLEDEFREEFDVLFKAFAGWGKTIASLILASRLGVSTLILVDQENLKDQWMERLVDPDLFGLSEDQIGTVQGKKCDYQGKVVTIAMVQTLSQKTFDPEFYDYFGFVVSDECHVMGAPTFSTILMMFPATYRMYVSATPRRRDGLQKALDHNCGPVRVEAENRREESKVYILRNSTVYSWYGNISPKVGRIITEVAEDSRRNLAIAHVIVQQWESGRDVLVIGDRVEHLQALCDMVYYMGVPEEHAGMFTGYTVSMEFTKDPTPRRVPEGATYEIVDGKRVYAPYTPVNWVAKEKKVPKARYQEILDTCSIIFASYHKFSKGADLPRLSVGIDVTPRSTAEQTIGRVQRIMEGKRQPLWITPVDENNFRLMHSFAGRVQEYAKANSRIYEWDGEKETKEWKIPELLAEVRGGVNRLKQMEIRPSADGVNRLVEKAQIKKEKLASQREEAKRLFKKPASSDRPRARRRR